MAPSSMARSPSVIPASLRRVHIAPLDLRDLRLDPASANVAVGVIAGEIATRLIEVEPEIDDGWAVAAPEQGLLKLVCVERHHATGRVGVGCGFRAAPGRAWHRRSPTTPTTSSRLVPTTAT